VSLLQQTLCLRQALQSRFSFPLGALEPFLWTACIHRWTAWLTNYMDQSTESSLRSLQPLCWGTQFAVWNSKCSFPCTQEPVTICIQSTPQPKFQTHFRSILKLFSHLHLDLLSGLFPSGFPSESVYAFLISAMPATRPTHPILPDQITLIIFDELYKLWSSLCKFLHPPVTSTSPP
jgi:hypothetical protein